MNGQHSGQEERGPDGGKSPGVPQKGGAAPGGAPRRRPGRLVRVVRWLVLGLAAVVLLPLAALQTGPVKRTLVNFLADVLAVQTGWRLEAKTLGGLWPFDIQLGDLRISDKSGVWLSMADARITLVPWIGPLGRPKVEAGFRQVRVTRIPAMPPSPSPAPPPGHPLAFLDQLAPIHPAFTARVAVEGLTLEKPVAGRDLAVNLSAQVTNTVDELTLEAGAERLDGPSTRLSLSAGLKPLDRSARLEAGLEEAPGGLVCELAGLGSDAPLSAKFSGAGPLAGWQGRLSVVRGGGDILDGTVDAALGRSSTEDARLGLTLSLYPGTLPLPEELHAALGDKADLSFKGVITSAGLQAPQWKLLVTELAVAANAGSAHLSGDLGVDMRAPSLAFEARLANPGSVNLPTGPFSVSGRMKADIDPAGPLSADVDLEVPHLAETLKPVKVDMDGTFRMKASLAGDTARDDFTLTLDGGLSGLSPGRDPQWAKLSGALGRDVTLQARARLDPARVVTLSQTRIESKAFTTTASGTFNLASRDIDMGLDLSAGDLSLLSGLAGGPLAGEFTASSRIRGNMATPSVSAGFQGSRLAFQGTRFDTAHGQVEAAVQADGSSTGKVSASVSRAKASLDLSTRFAMAGGRLGLSALTVSGPGVDASGDLDVGIANATASGRFKAGADLGRLGAFLGRPMAGTARLEADLKASGPRQDAVLSLAAAGVKGFGVVVNKAQVSGTATDVTRAPKGSLRASLAGAKMGEASLASLDFQASGNGREASFTLKTKGTLPEPFGAETSGVFAPAPGGGRLRLDRFQASYSGARMVLERPASLAFGPEGGSLSDLSLSVGSGRISASGRMASGAVALSADVTDFPLELLGKVHVAEGISGTAQARLRLSGEPRDPKVEAALTLSRVGLDALAGRPVPPVHVQASAEYSQGRATSKCRVTAGEGVSMEAEAAIPIRLSLRPAAFALPAAPMEASLKGTADLSALASFSGQEDLWMKGTLTADLSARGRPEAPDIEGRIGIENGDVEYAATGTVLKNMNLRVEAQGSEIDIREFSASDAQSGTVSAHGRMAFSASGPFSLDMNVALDKVALLRSDMVNAVLSGAIAVSGDSSGMTARGKLSTGEVVVNIPHRIPPDDTPVAVTMVDAPRSQASQWNAEPSGPSVPLPVKLDMDVDFPGHIFVRGFGLDSVWDGHLHVGGTADSPAVAGSIDVVRGRIDFFGKPFNLVRGDVSFTGGPPANPRLDMDAQYQGSDITADILVTGDAKRPKVSFSSDPALPQDEILSHVLFGKSAASLTVPQALQLAQAAASLTGKGDTLDLLGRTRKLVGLDYLGLGSSKGPDTGQMAITAGKYISDKVYVETSQGFGGQGPKVSVQVDVFPHVTLDSTTGVDAKTGVGINWKLDY